MANLVTAGRKLNIIPATLIANQQHYVEIIILHFPASCKFYFIKICYSA